MEVLADKLRPQCIDDIIGQKHLVGEDKINRHAGRARNHRHGSQLPQHHQHPRQKKKERRRRGRRDDYIAGLSG